MQCDQMGRFIGLWAIYWTLGDFLKPSATINLPKSPTFLAIFVIFYHFLVKSFWATFIDIWQFFMVTLWPCNNGTQKCGHFKFATNKLRLLHFVFCDFTLKNVEHGQRCN